MRNDEGWDQKDDSDPKSPAHSLKGEEPEEYEPRGGNPNGQTNRIGDDLIRFGDVKDFSDAIHTDPWPPNVPDNRTRRVAVGSG